MARKLARGEGRERHRLDTERDVPTADEIDSSDRGRLLLQRREYVRAGAAAVAATVGLANMASPAAAASEYETIVLAENEQRRVVLSDGEAFENVLIDQTAPGSMLSILVEDGANDWAIRNVGWKGLAPTGADRQDTFLIHVRGDGVIENVFIDQRNHDGDGEGSDVGGIWTYSDSHHGHIECRHNFIAGCGNNASYASGDGWERNAATGTIEHYRSYHRDNTVSNFRPGRSGCYVRECVSVVNDPTGTRGSYPGSDSQLSRAIWAWHNPEIYMVNCAIWHDPDDVQPAKPFWATWRDGSGGDYCELNVVDCDVNASWDDELVPSGHGGDDSDTRRVTFEGLGTSPDVSVLGSGVPTTPEMAAAGERQLPPALGTAPSGGHGVDDSTEEDTSTDDDSTEDDTSTDDGSTEEDTSTDDGSTEDDTSTDDGSTEDDTSTDDDSTEEDTSTDDEDTDTKPGSDRGRERRNPRACRNL